MEQTAVWSAIVAGLALLGLCCLGVGGLLLGPIAYFLGGSSLSRIRASGGALSGAGLAQLGRVGGLVTALLGLLILLLYILAVSTWTLPSR